MTTDNTFLAPLSPIRRATPAQRLANFDRQSNSIYNKFSYYDDGGGDIGFRQPFVYTKITDSELAKNLTKYDSYTFPIGSTIRDVQRVGKFMGSGTGMLFVGKQLFMQNLNAFNETRVYNPLSVLKATAKPGSLGLIDYPPRHVETSGGLLNFFKNALLDTVGFQASTLNQARIEGTAEGDTYAGTPMPAYSKYAGVKGGAKYGLLRFETANRAKTQFSTIWADNTSQNAGGGFLSNLGSALVNRLAAMIPSTNPFRSGSSSSQLSWKYRIEYPKNQAGIYHSFINTNSGLLAETAKPHRLFYNDTATGATGTTEVKEFQRYYPSEGTVEDKTKWYAPRTKIQDESVGIKTEEDGTVSDGNGSYTNNLKDLHKRMVAAIENYNGVSPQFAKSKERYTAPSGSYTDIPGDGYGNSNSGKDKHYSSQIAMTSETVDTKYFAGPLKFDKYNASPKISGSREYLPDILNGTFTDQSRDIIYFYFYDLVNKVYLPFRATINGLSEQHSAEWEDIKYIGRADRLFVYKGFTRDLNLNFKVYANSAHELIPMWERLSYLVGLTRPSKYTDRAVVTNVNNRARTEESVDDFGDTIFTQIPENSTTGRESKFIYPPMITVRIGDMYDDQPAVISSVNVNIPDETNWESFRGDSYKYLYGINKNITLDGVKSRQLPLQADVSMQLRLLEKKQALVTNAHYGREDSSGNWWAL